MRASRSIQHVNHDSTEPTQDPSAGGETPADGQEKQWWDDEGMPWKKEPGRSDYACLIWFGVIVAFSLVLLPLRAFIPLYPDWFAMLTGGRTSVALSGAVASIGEMGHWPVVLAVASVMSLKFDWVYWWAGKLWGHGMIEVWAGQSKRAARNYARAERWAEKLGPLGFLIAYVPLPLPLMQVVFVLAGASNMSLKRFLVYDYIASTLWLVLYFWLGWRFGEPVVDVLEVYAKYAGYVAIALIVVVVVTSFMRASKKAKAEGSKG